MPLQNDEQYPVLTSLINDTKLIKENTESLYGQALALSATNANLEIVSARKGEADLSSKIGKIDTSLNNKTNLNNNRVDLLNSTAETVGAFELANFAGQGQPSPPIGTIIHHYTDAEALQIDNVGENNALITLKNANNSIRRPDKPANFVGSGKFLSLNEHDYAAGYSKELFFISNIAEFVWTGVKGIITFVQNKIDDNTYGFRYKLSNTHYYLLDIVNGVTQILYMISNASNTRVDICTPASQLNGLWVETKAGNLNLVTAAGSKVKSNLNTVMTIRSGTTANRPTTNIEVGEFYFDTSINKPIWRNSNNNGWVDANGYGV